MKQLIIAASIVIALASCTDRKPQIMKQDGTILTVGNPEHIDLKVGDSVVLYNYSAGLYVNREIRGFWKSVLPASSMDSTYYIYYEVVQVYKP